MSFDGIELLQPGSFVRVEPTNYSALRAARRWDVCAYCGRDDDAYSDGSCKGCGARRRRGHWIDVTRIGDREPQKIFVPE